VSDTGLSLKQLAKRNRRARRNLALKLSLEKTFLPEIRRYFNRIAREISIQVAEGGRPSLDTEISNQTVELLSVQYRRVARAFQNEMRLFLSEKSTIGAFEIKQEEQDEKNTEAVAMAVGVFIGIQSRERSSVINQTTQSEIEQVTTETVAEELAAGNPITGAVFATVLANKLRQKFSSRFNTIALTETQFSSEKVKQIEAAIIGRADDVSPTSAGASELITGRVRGEPSTTKEWAAILDQVTRIAHVIADGQKRPINDPFNVDSELLMEPGDPSLGASAGNLINCRCSALYTI